MHDECRGLEYLLFSLGLLLALGLLQLDRRRGGAHGDLRLVPVPGVTLCYSSTQQRETNHYETN